MNKNDFRNPLIQSGIVLLVIFILISIVANSGSEGMLGSIGALISGLFSGILFLLALVIGILFSIAILIGIYIAVVSFQSTDRGREVFNQVVDSVKNFYGKISGSVSERRAERAEKRAASAAKAPASPAAAPATSDEMKEAWKNIKMLKVAIQEIQASQISVEERLIAIQGELHSPESDDLNSTLENLKDTQQSLGTTLEELSGRMDAENGRISDLENSYSNTCEKLEAEIAELHKKTSVPEVVSGILSYIDRPEDRDTITEKAEEAISRGMTYNQIDEFFKSSLDPKVYKVLASHPRLTKDFLRSIKKKFA
jgi:transcriptional regulator with XRE-family HTH domain